MNGKYITLPIQWNSTERQQLENLDIIDEESLEGTYVKQVTYFQITRIYTSKNYGHDFTIICNGEIESLCPLPEKKVFEMIQEAFK